MAISEKQKGDFVDAYTKALVASWSDEDYASRLESDPRTALAEVGLFLPAGASVHVETGAPASTTVETVEPQARLQRQVDLYEAGFASGHFEFHMPATPQIDTAELDIEDLASVSGGITCCSCCCPCCCCG